MVYRCIRSLICLCFAFTLADKYSLGQGGTMLLEDSFENGQGVPEGWSEGAGVPGVNYVYDKSNGSEGKRSLSLQKSADRYFPIAQWSRTINFDQASKKLEVTAKIKAAKVTKSIVELQFLSKEGEFIGKEWVMYIGQKKPSDPLANHNWKEYKGQVAVPEGTKQVVVAFQIYGPGSVWLDELSIGEANSSKSGSKTGPTNNSVSDSTKSESTRDAELPQPQSLKVASGGWTRFVLIPPSDSKPKPKEGFPLLLVLPGGDGSIEFHPFIKSIHEKAMDSEAAVVHVLAPPQVVWPTSQSQARYATTEDALAAIVEHVAAKMMIDRTRVIALAWSSSGPAVYESILSERSPIQGAFIAMSVFREKDFPTLSFAKGRPIYLLHSPEDRVCPYAMAKAAESRLSAAGAKVKLVDYTGGHGWHGDVFSMIRTGMKWVFEAN